MSSGVLENTDSGHDFHKKLLRPGNSCHHCGESLWGSSAACRCCKFVAHERCSEGAVTPCSRVAINYIANPVAHTWSLQQKFKKKFCNVCRRKMDDRLGVRCVVCKYYVHKRCMPTSLPVCKRSADYDAFVTPDEQSHALHQWTEGNLKAADKCAVCSQACGGSDCLSGQRCLWCLATVHSSCMGDMERSCKPPSALRNLMLPAYAVYQPRMPATEQPLPHAISEHGAITSQQLAEHMLGFRLHETGDGDTVSIAESLASDIMSQSSSMVSLKVYDSSVDRYKKILVPADANPEEMLVASQQEFNIRPEDAGQFCLALETAPSTYEPVDKLAGELEAADKLVFRSTEHHMSRLRVYWNVGQHKVEQRTLSVSPVTTASEVVDQAIAEFGLVIAEECRRDYVLVELNMHADVQERVLDEHEKPWKVMRDFAKLSVQQLQMVRLYLRNVKMDVPCTFYVGNLPIGWEEARLVESLKQALGTLANDDIIFGPAFPQFGSIFLFSHNEESARQACTMLSTAILVDAKRPTVYLVPTIQDEVIPDSSSPLLVFVNERSGGGQGAELLTQMIRLVNPHQIFNLSHGGPLPGLFAFRNLKSFRVLVAGGDGTVGWVLSQMDAMRPLLKNANASVAVIPLGTGNDLARVLRWGAGFGGESAMSILEVMEDSLIVPLDRWNVDFDGGEFGATTSPVSIGGSGSANPTVAAQSFVMNNYLGIGVEAEIALKFHLAREENPEKFNSRLHNKGVYLKMSIGKMMQRGGGEMSRDLSKVMVLDVDKERIVIPSGVEGIIILNIKSWMAGCDGWGAEKDDKFKAPAMNDGLLEVIGVQGVMHLGQIQGGLRGGIRLAQGSDISFRISCPTPVEIDGEPFMQPAGQCRVVQGNTMQMMRRHKRPAGINPPPSVIT